MKSYIKICRECNRKFRCIGTCLDRGKRECYCPECNWEEENWREKDNNCYEPCYKGIKDPYNVNPWKQDINTGKRLE